MSGDEAYGDEITSPETVEIVPEETTPAPEDAPPPQSPKPSGPPRVRARRPTPSAIAKEAARRFPKMVNRSMAAELVAGTAIDVRSIGTPAEEPGVYELRAKDYQPDRDYCDQATERWIWVIAVESVTEECAYAQGKPVCRGAGCHGRMFASIDDRLHGAEHLRTIWLR